MYNPLPAAPKSGTVPDLIDTIRSQPVKILNCMEADDTPYVLFLSLSYDFVPDFFIPHLRAVVTRSFG